MCSTCSILQLQHHGQIGSLSILEIIPCSQTGKSTLTVTTLSQSFHNTLSLLRTPFGQLNNYSFFRTKTQKESTFSKWHALHNPLQTTPCSLTLPKTLVCALPHFNSALKRIPSSHFFFFFFYSTYYSFRPAISNHLWVN